MSAGVCDYYVDGVEDEKMTKQEFWRLIANQLENCKYCPVKIGSGEVECHRCPKALEEFYERLERGEDGRE